MPPFLDLCNSRRSKRFCVRTMQKGFPAAPPPALCTLPRSGFVLVSLCSGRTFALPFTLGRPIALLKATLCDAIVCRRGCKTRFYTRAIYHYAWQSEGNAPPFLQQSPCLYMYASNVGAAANPSLQQHVSRETATHTCTQAAFLQGVDLPQPLCRLYRQKAKDSMQGQAMFHVKHWPQLHDPQAYKHILFCFPAPTTLSFSRSLSATLSDAQKVPPRTRL